MTIDDLLKELVEKDGADLFLVVGAPPSIAIKGKLIPISEGKLKPDMIKKLAVSLMNEKQKVSFVKNKELNISYSIHGMGRFRVNIYNQRGTIGMVIRRIKLEIMTLDDLNLPPILKDLVMEKRGLILVTGATGSGKSTTLAAMIDYRNRNSDGHIVTIEDPLEFVHNHKKSIVTQREIGMDTLSFENALKSALRQAPNVLLVGEIRDRETMDAAISFAETGHIVLSTLHSNNANQTLERILNFFPSDMHSMVHLQLSLNLKGVICQRLVPTIDEEGRAAILEIMISTPRIADLIHKGDTAGLKSVIAAGTHEGMQTFDQHLYKLYKDEKISFETAMKAADSANDLKLRIKMESSEEIKTDGISLEEEDIEETLN